MSQRDDPQPERDAALPAAFGALARWVAALHGHGDLAPALAGLARLFGAEAALALRLAEGPRNRLIAEGEAASPRLVRLQPRRGMLGDVAAPALATLRRGTLVTLADIRAGASFAEGERLAERLRATALGDVALLVLDTRGALDHLELHFVRPIRRRERVLLLEMAPALAAAWADRLPGLVERILARPRHARAGEPAGAAADILDPGNPAGLSRSEYRICALVREGLVAKAIARELDLQESTVRSHLRSIYAKTGASGHVDLLHRLAIRAPAYGIITTQARGSA